MGKAQSWHLPRIYRYPGTPIDPGEIVTLRACHLRWPDARTAWLKVAKIRVKKRFATRGYRLVAAAGVVLTNDGAAQRYAMDALRKLADAVRQDKARLLGLFKDDGSPDVCVYSLGKGNTYLKRFRAGTEDQKKIWRTEIRAASAVARVRGGKKGGKKGALKSEETVKK